MDERRAHAALRAVLHALRDCLPLQEIAQFSAQLPTFIRGLYYEGWSPTHTQLRKRDAESFLAQIRAGFEKTRPAVDARTISRAVFRVIQERISQGEVEHIKSLLPARIRQFWPEEESGDLEPKRPNTRKVA